MEKKKDTPADKAVKSEKLLVSGNWRKKLRSREEILKYLQTGERYWFSKDWYGSEKRANPA